MPTLHPTEPRWFAISTRSKSEKVVKRLLSQKGVNVYVPISHVQRQFSNGRKRWVELPLISCYAFVKITSNEYRKVLQTDHVIKFVRLADELRAIPESEIEILKQVTGEQQLSVTAIPFQFQTGQEVEITYGPLTGMKAKLVEQKGQRKVLIELENVGYSLQVTIHQRHLRPTWMNV